MRKKALAKTLLTFSKKFLKILSQSRPGHFAYKSSVSCALLLSNMAILLHSCDFLEPPPKPSTHKGEYITRLHDEHLAIPPLIQASLPDYPWQKKLTGNFPEITKEYFRCKGKIEHPEKLIEQAGGNFYIQDCAGIEDHSLPLKEGKEFIYPILLKLLNYVQEKTKARVLITSGHRCPAHNRYNDPLPKSQYSKHQIGAEVSFYVVGFEKKPEAIISWLQEYYLSDPSYQGLSDYTDFKRWERPVDVSTPPWYNKEIFIKLYYAHEGRNFDNSHSYPYLAVQVRFDRASKERVNYSWEAANCYWRW